MILFTFSLDEDPAHHLKKRGKLPLLNSKANKPLLSETLEPTLKYCKWCLAAEESVDFPPWELLNSFLFSVTRTVNRRLLHAGCG